MPNAISYIRYIPVLKEKKETFSTSFNQGSCCFKTLYTKKAILQSYYVNKCTEEKNRQNEFKKDAQVKSIIASLEEPVLFSV